MTLALNLKIVKILTLISIAFIFSIVYLIFVSHSFAQTATSESSPKTRMESKKERIETRKTKLDAAKLRVCQVKEKVLGNRLGSLTKMSENMLEKFDKIAARVENFYTEKVLTAGKTVSNYDSLVADIAAKKAAVDASLTTAKINAVNFSCNTDDPKGDLTQFRTDMQAVKSALADYRTSIKNLIVAVKTAAGGRTSE